MNYILRNRGTIFSSRLLILSLALLVVGCQEKEEEEMPDIESLVNLEDEEKEDDWEFEVHDKKALAHDNEEFVQEIIIDETSPSPTLQDSQESLR